ncbi:MAG: type II secretion system ATPase GspE [Pseudohongiellaceae bacterium]
MIGERQLSFDYSRQHGVLLGDGVVCHRPGLSLATLLELQRILGQPFALQELSEDSFQAQLTERFRGGTGDAQRAVDELDGEADLDTLIDDIARNTDLLSSGEDAPVVRLINAILAQALREQVSDVHIEPFEDRVAIRFRADGVLSEVLSPRPELAPLLVSRLKVMARLDIAEKRLPQDGRISVRLGGQTVDIRLSTIPNAHGERVVLRLLDQSAGRLGLPQLAMPGDLERCFTAALRKPHGIILVTGPTGSGKTTTLYAGLNEINDRKRNILTIEDPVEYLLPGIGQTQVNSRIGMSFVQGLRAILRQDPDVVMVGEIRDTETAAVAIQASLTGHLVLSTLHTNTAIGAIMRLKDMGVEPFLVASSLELVMAQRLVRLLCHACREAYEPGVAEGKRYRLLAGATLFRPVGCEQCRMTGYRGRTGVYEVIEVTDALRQMIHQGAGEHELLSRVRQGSVALLDNAMTRVKSGETSLEEVLRVVAQESRELS